MIRATRTAYGAGWRAGMARPPVKYSGETCPKTGARLKVLDFPVNPYACWWQFFQRAAWESGCHAGRMESAQRWTAGRVRA